MSPMSDIVQDLIRPHLSTAREKALEHRLISDLAVLMLRRGMSLDVLRSEFDAQGYDVVLEAGQVIRHIQLKASREGGKRRHVDINVRLRAKPGGCVVWINYDPATLAITTLRWFGGLPGEQLPDLGSIVTRHSKGDRQGTKHCRPALRNLSIARFETVESLDELADRLFGSAMTPATASAAGQLQMQFGQHWRTRVASDLEGTTFDTSVGWAHLIDGYAVLEQMLEVQADIWLEGRAQEVADGQLSDDAGELWTQLFLEHRRWRMLAPSEPFGDNRKYLDDLAAKAARAIRVQMLELNPGR